MRHIITAILLCISSISYAFDDADIVFSYKHSMRINNNHVVIYYNKNQTTLRVVEKTLNGKESSRMVKITPKQTESINNLFKKINWDTVDPKPVLGLDGHSWGIITKNIRKSVWVPSHRTTERGLNEYLALCMYLLKSTGLNENANKIK